MKKVIRLTERDLMRLVKRVIKEEKNHEWKNFVSVIMTMVPKPKLSPFKYGYPEEKMGQNLGWFNDVNHYYSVSINSLREEITISANIKQREIEQWWKQKGYSFSSLTKIPISFNNPEKVKNDLTEFFKTFPSK